MPFNIITFRKQTEKARNSFKNIAYNAALTRFTAAKNESLKDFDDHPITKELRAGPDASNSSGTLGGKGNLFSFIGFYEGEDPTNIVREALEVYWNLERTPIIEDKGNRINFKFKVNSPSLTKLYSLTPLPWEEGRSWLRGIEKGISGLGNYIYWKTLPNPPSRSGTGIQSQTILRNAIFRPRDYMTEILKTFESNFRR